MPDPLRPSTRGRSLEQLHIDVITDHLDVAVLLISQQIACAERPEAGEGATGWAGAGARQEEGRRAVGRDGAVGGDTAGRGREDHGGAAPFERGTA